MILPGQLGGKVGHRRESLETLASKEAGVFSFR
jgi:hypothetical protein